MTTGTISQNLPNHPLTLSWRPQVLNSARVTAMAPKPASEHLGPQWMLPRSILKLEIPSQCQNPPLTKFTSPVRLKCDITQHFLDLQMGYSKLTLVSSTTEQVLTGTLHYYLNQRDMCSSQLIHNLFTTCLHCQGKGIFLNLHATFRYLHSTE